MTSVKVLNEESLCDFFTNKEGELCIISTPTCGKCMHIVKAIEQNDMPASLYRIQEPDSIGADIFMDKLGIQSVPAAVYARDKKIDLLLNAGNYTEVEQWMKQITA